MRLESRHVLLLRSQYRWPCHWPLIHTIRVIVRHELISKNKMTKDKDKDKNSAPWQGDPRGLWLFRHWLCEQNLIIIHKHNGQPSMSWKVLQKDSPVSGDGRCCSFFRLSRKQEHGLKECVYDTYPHYLQEGIQNFVGASTKDFIPIKCGHQKRHLFVLITLYRWRLVGH